MAVMGTCSMWVSALKRARLACYVLAAVVATVAIAWSKPGHWTKPPTITVIAEAGDPRSEAVREAVAFWNRTFAELGTPFRLGDVTWVTDSIPGRRHSSARQTGSISPVAHDASKPRALFRRHAHRPVERDVHLLYGVRRGPRRDCHQERHHAAAVAAECPAKRRGARARSCLGTQSQSRSAVADVRAPGALPARRVRVGVGENVSVVGGRAEPAAELLSQKLAYSRIGLRCRTISTVSSSASKMIRASPRSS